MPRAIPQSEGVYENVPGSGIWYVRYRKQGKLVRKSIGKYQAALDYHRKVKVLIRSGEGYVPDTAKGAPKTDKQLERETAKASGVTIGQLCDDLLKQIQDRPLEYKDQHNPPHRIGLIKKAFGDRAASGVKVHEVSDWFRSLPMAPATQNRYRAVFSAVFNYGMQRDMIQSNPVRATVPMPVDNGVIRWLLPTEEERIRKVLQDDVDACGPRNQQLKKHMIHRICEFDVAIFTGMREGEQYDLVWDDVNFEANEATARDTKNGTSRQVHLTKTAVKALRTLEAMDLERKRRSADTPNPSAPDVIFAIRDNKNWWGQVLRRAEVKNFRWHDLRHTFCSRLAQGSVGIKVIQELAGHKTIQMSARYAHLDKTSVLKGLAVLEQG